MGMVTQTFHGRRSDDYISLTWTQGVPSQRKNSFVTESMESTTGTCLLYTSPSPRDRG